MLQARRSVQKRMKASDTKGLSAQGLVKSLEHVANNFASMSTDDVNAALAAAAEALATLSPAIQEQVGFLQNTVDHAVASVEVCHAESGVEQRAALWEAAEAQAVLSATCEAELATANEDEARICSEASVADVQSGCACDEATARREDKEELCAAILAAYEFAYCEHNLQCGSYHECHETELAVYNSLREDVDNEMGPIELEYIAAQQSTCIMGVIQANMLAGEAIDFGAIAACSAVDTSPLLIVYPDLPAAPDACPGATTGSPPCISPSYMKMAYGEANCPEGKRITTYGECEVAHAALGLEINPVWHGTYGAIPGLCSTREEDWGGGHHFHFNNQAVGVVRADLAPVCRA